MQRPVTEPTATAARHVIEPVETSEPFKRQSNGSRRMHGIGRTAHVHCARCAKFRHSLIRTTRIATGHHHAPRPGCQKRLRSRPAQPRRAAHDDEHFAGKGLIGHAPTTKPPAERGKH